MASDFQQMSLTHLMEQKIGFVIACPFSEDCEPFN